MNYVYYRVQFKLIREMLGACCAASIWNEHVIQKSKKEIKAANILSNRITKHRQKYIGPDISDDKQVKELQGILRRFSELTGEVVEIPDDIDELLETAKEFEQLLEEKLSTKDSNKATVFMLDEQGWPMLSTHIIIGNLKENLKIMVNSDDKSIMPSKVSVGESLALDVKPIDEFMRPSCDIVKDEQGKPVICERPILFDRMGKKETAIVRSETLPVGTEFGTILRVRATSRLTKENLERLFDFGKSNGFGPWRGSGNRGAYVYKIEELPDYKEDFDGWN